MKRPTTKRRGLVEVFLRHDGRSPYWMFRTTDPITGKRRAVSTKRTDPDQALEVAEAWYRERLDRKQLGTLPTLTVAQALANHIASRPRRASNNRLEGLADKIVGRNPRAARVLAPDHPLEAVTQADVVRLHATRLREGMAPRSANYEAMVLVAAWRSARDQGYAVGRLPLKAVREKTAQKTHWLSPQQFQALLDELHPDRPIPTKWGPFVPPANSTLHTQRQDAWDLAVAHAYLGGRWKEIARLTWPQVDLEGGSARLWGYKTQTERLVPLSDIALTMLRNRWLRRKPGETYVFPSKAGKEPRKTCAAIGRAMTAIGLNTPDRVERFGRATIHSLRHTFASWLLQRGMSLEGLRDLLGHATVQQSERYAHLISSDTQTRATAILDTIGAK